MSISLDPSVQAELDSGRYGLIHLIFFAIPTLNTGYWRGARDLVYNSVTYKPSRYLDDSGLVETLGIDITERTITFSDVPTTDSSDVIANIESYNYLNALVTVTKLVVDIENDSILGLAESSVYEIDSVNYLQNPINESGERSVTVRITLEIPGRSVRDSTGVKYSDSEQKAHNSATDTFFEYAASSAAFEELWGQISG
jgi:hypothetical protein